LNLHMSIKPDPEVNDRDAFIFVFKEQLILVREDDNGYSVPRVGELAATIIAANRKLYLGTLENRPCYALDLNQEIEIPGGFSLIGLRELFDHVDLDLFTAAGYAFQIVHWDRMHQFCGKCGAPAEDASSERAKTCPDCKAVYYPKISPAVIVAVRKGNKLLLARNKKRKLGFFSVLAGFVEPGETLEECVEREVREETGIEVKNIKYFGSQPWPFPNALMIGFTADYASGEIKVDNYEIAEAAWFTPDNFPTIPGRISIARKLIDAFLDEQKKADKIHE